MSNIHQHIKQLLSEHDCVIIPHFGAFIADYAPATISDDESASIPFKDILFNKNLTRNDGLLMNAIIEEEEIEYPEAKAEIEKYVRDTQAKLSQGRSVIYEGVGTLKQDEIGFLHFEQEKNNELLRTAYGLKPVKLEKINRSITTHQAEQTKQEPENNTKRKTLLRLASTVAVVVIMVLLATPIKESSLSSQASLAIQPSESTIITDKKADTPQPLEEIDNTIAPTSVNTQSETTSLPLSRKNPIETTEETKAITTPEVITPSKKYHIIIASLANKSAALEYEDRFKNNYNFNTTSTLEGSGRYRISVANFQNEDEALAFVKSLRLLNPKFKDAWVLAQRQ